MMDTPLKMVEMVEISMLEIWICSNAGYCVGSDGPDGDNRSQRPSEKRVFNWWISRSISFYIWIYRYIYIYIFASEVQIMLPATNVKTIENLWNTKNVTLEEASHSYHLPQGISWSDIWRLERRTLCPDWFRWFGTRLVDRKPKWLFVLFSARIWRLWRLVGKAICWRLS